MKSHILISITALFWASIAWAGPADEFRASSNSPHKIRILEKGLAALHWRLKLIESATKTIDVESFIYKPDRSGQMITQALEKKARQGVKVRILIDKSPLAPPLDKFIAAELKKAGVELRYFNPISLAQLGQAQFRSHRKFIIVDDKEMITGGRNIGDEYFEHNEEFNFVDRDIWLAGPIVKAVKKSFEAFWGHKLTKHPKPIRLRRFAGERAMNRQRREQLRRHRQWVLRKIQLARAFFHQTPELNAMEKTTSEWGPSQMESSQVHECPEVEFISDGPGKKRENRIFGQALYDKILEAKESILIETPYFIAVKGLSDVLATVLGNGVETTLVTNSVHANNHPSVANAFHQTIGPWTKMGLKAYLLKGTYMECEGCLPSSKIDKKTVWGLHAKSVIIDDTVMVGTYNFDPQSHFKSSEMAIFCKGSQGLVDELKTHIASHQEHSLKLNHEGRPENGESILHGTDVLGRFMYYLRALPVVLLKYIL